MQHISPPDLSWKCAQLVSICEGPFSRTLGTLGVDSPFFSTIVLFTNRLFPSWVSDGLLKRTSDPWVQNGHGRCSSTSVQPSPRHILQAQLVAPLTCRGGPLRQHRVLHVHLLGALLRRGHVPRLQKDADPRLARSRETLGVE